MGNIYFERGLNLSLLLRKGNHDWLAGVGAIGEPVLLSRGRDCLYVALRAIGAEQGDAISVPAFICAEVPRLIAEWGFSPIPYDIEPDLSLSPDLVKKSLTSRTRAILYVNYFGLQQPAASLDKLKGLGLPLVEDNCQAPMAGSKRAVQPDFAFTSMRKYLPVPDGAVLDVIDNRWRERVGGVTLRRRTNGQLVRWRIAALLVRGQQEIRDRRVLRLLAQELFSKAEQALRGYDVPVAMHGVSRRLAATFDIAAIRTERRSVYEKLVTAMKTHPALRPLRLELAATDCPHCCPLLTDGNRLWRDALNQRGIEAAILWKVEQFSQDRSISAELSRRILSLPLPRLEALRSCEELMSSLDV